MYLNKGRLVTSPDATLTVSIPSSNKKSKESLSKAVLKNLIPFSSQ